MGVVADVEPSPPQQTHTIPMPPTAGLCILLYRLHRPETSTQAKATLPRKRARSQGQLVRLSWWRIASSIATAIDAYSRSEYHVKVRVTRCAQLEWPSSEEVLKLFRASEHS